MLDDPIINAEENVVTYKVVLDPSDIARQAEEIRNQLDQALTVDNTTQFVGSTEFVTPQFNYQSPEFTPLIGNFSPPVDAEGFENVKAQITSIYEDIATGLTKIRQDMSMLVDGTANLTQGSLPIGGFAEDRYATLLPDTLPEKILASLGLGGDITGPIAPSEYQQYAETSLRESFKDVLQNPGEFISSVTDDWAGAGPVGLATYLGAHFLPVIGPTLTAAETIGLADEWLSGAYNKREDLAGGLQEIAAQQFGVISNEEARSMAQNVLDFVNSYQGYAQEYSIEEVSSNILQFANEGGFASTTNAKEMQNWITTLTEEMRQIARNLGVFQEEAVSIVAELAQKSMVTSETIRDLTEQVKYYGGILQRDPVELLQGAAITAEQFRQTGMFQTPETAMQIYFDASVEAQRLIKSNDPFVQSSVYRMGGVQGVTQGLISMYGSYQNSMLGDYTTMFQSVGGSGSNINNVIAGIGQNFSNLDDYTWYLGRGREQTLAKQDVIEAQFNYIETLASIYQTLNGEIPSWEHLEGFAQLPGIKEMTGTNLTSDQIRTAVQTVKSLVTETLTGKNPQEMLKYGKIVSLLKSAEEEAQTTLIGEINANTIRYIDEFGREISYGYGGLKKESVDQLESLTTHRIDTYGNRTYGGFSLLKSAVETGLSNVFGGSSPFSPLESRDEQLKNGDYTIYVDLDTEFVRKQVSAGRYSLVGQDIEKKVRMDKEQEAIDFLSKSYNINIKDRTELYTKDIQNLLKPQKLDQASIQAFQDMMWGVDSSITEDEKFAMKMWSNTPVISMSTQSYYKEQIEDFIENNMDALKDEQGNFYSLETIMDIFASNIKPLKEGMSDNLIKQIIFQASEEQTNQEFRQKMIDKEEAKSRGRKVWDILEEGDKLRNEYFDNLQKNYDKTIVADKEALKKHLRTSQMQLEGTVRERYENIIEQVLDEFSTSKEQLSPEELEIKFLERTKELYNQQITQLNKNFPGVNNYAEWDDTNLATTTRKLFASGVGGDIFKNFTETISKRNVAETQQAVYKAVEERVSKYRDATQLDLNSADIATALYTILPQQAASGQGIDIPNLTNQQLEAASRLVNALKESTDLSGVTVDAIKNFAKQYNIGEKDVYDKLKITQEQIQQVNDKEIGNNVDKIRTDLERIRIMISGKLNYKWEPTSTGKQEKP